jgi:hypothetical protein
MSELPNPPILSPLDAETRALCRALARELRDRAHDAREAYRLAAKRWDAGRIQDVGAAWVDWAPAPAPRPGQARPAPAPCARTTPRERVTPRRVPVQTALHADRSEDQSGQHALSASRTRCFGNGIGPG